ncbi:MAG TPA: hypothetical protein V6C57_08765 [Coleofasciculaceae cyanobacterium]
MRTQHQLDGYTQQIKGKRSLKQRLNKLVEICTHEGYMAEVQAQADESFLLIENHCPICAAATACTGLCAKELEIFQSNKIHVLLSPNTVQLPRDRAVQ